MGLGFAQKLAVQGRHDTTEGQLALMLEALASVKFVNTKLQMLALLSHTWQQVTDQSWHLVHWGTHVRKDSISGYSCAIRPDVNKLLFTWIT